MGSTEAVTPATAYDEFGLFHENAQEFGIALDAPPLVRRVSVDISDGYALSALQWGSEPPEVVLLHGGAQNAHTWDTVALALDRPLVAIDLPGHGHSGHRDDHVYWPADNAVAIEKAVRALAPDAALVVGMSLGGLTALALADRAPDLVRQLVLVDVTPGVNREKSSAIAKFIDGPEFFESFDEILERTIAFNPTRSGVVAAARDPAQRDRDIRRSLALALRPARRGSGEGEGGQIMPGLTDLWDAVSRLRMPLTLVRGSLSPVVDDEDVAELLRRCPTAIVEVVEGSGHSVQGDKPLELARILADRL